MRFREDILRGVRLFAIVFAAILVCVAGYRIARTPADVPLAAPDGSATSETAQPSPEPEAAPVAPASAEVHPLVVPEPPPVGGAPVRARVTRPQRDPGVPPPPPIAAPVVRARRPAPSGREFEASDTVALPAAQVEESPEPKPLTPKQVVGYKSLIEANANRPVAEPAAPAPASNDGTETPAKGNRFFKAIGKIFRPGGKKETEPATLQPRQ